MILHWLWSIHLYCLVNSQTINHYPIETVDSIHRTCAEYKSNPLLINCFFNIEQNYLTKFLITSQTVDDTCYKSNGDWRENVGWYCSFVLCVCTYLTGRLNSCNRLESYLSKVVLFFDIEQPESLNSYKVKISVVAYVMKRQSLNESGNTSSFTGCF